MPRLQTSGARWACCLMAPPSALRRLTAIHYIHRLAAYAVIAAVLLLVYALRKQPALASQRKWLLGLIALQFATGLSNVVLDWPLLAAVLHTGGAAGPGHRDDLGLGCHTYPQRPGAAKRSQCAPTARSIAA